MQIETILDTIRHEEKRNNALLHLTANEGQMSETARQVLDWKLSERYYYAPTTQDIMDNGKFTALGLPAVSELVDKAEKATQHMLGGAVTTLYCLSGIHAMMSAILSTTEAGDGIMTIHVQDGGHFATEHIVNMLGRRHSFAVFDQEKLSFDVEQTATLFRTSKAHALYLDMSYYVNPHNLAELRQALGEQAIIIYDASHTMGLLMGNTFQDPFAEGADVICANTHKTLPGPQKGMVVFKDRGFGSKAVQKINFRLFSSPHVHHLIALCITILEMQEYGKAYARQVIANANALGKAFEDLGYDMRKANTGRYSENHQLHLFVDGLEPTNLLYRRLLQNNISTHFNKVLGGRDFIRFGTQEVTRRGMKEADMATIANLLHAALKGEDVAQKVDALNSGFTKILYSFDEK